MVVLEVVVWCGYDLMVVVGLYEMLGWAASYCTEPRCTG